MKRYMFVAMIALSCAIASAQDQNLLKNGDFSANENGVPASWKNMDAHAKIAIITQDLPEGFTSGLSAELVTAADNHGQIIQGISPVKPKSDFRVEGWVKSADVMGAYIQIKLLKNKKEFMRINSEGSVSGKWMLLKKDFNSEDADTIQIILRFAKKPSSIGSKSLFTGIKLVPVEKPAQP